MEDRLGEGIKKFIVEEKLIADGEVVLAGVSGGADSVCLFHVLRQLREELSFDLAVVHINHMIREAAEEEALFVEKLCGENEIPFYRRDINIPGIVQKADLSEEEAGRNERYKAFLDIAGELSRKTGKTVKIATAHNMGDQAETVLHNLFRGSRIKGLSGIRAKGERDGVVLIRPLLETERSEIEEYLKQKGFKYCNDSSNFTDDYTRNRIRHNVIPVAKEQINAKAGRHVAEAAAYLSRIDDYIDEQARLVEGWLVESSKDEVVLDCGILAAQPEIIRERLITNGIHLLYPHVKDIQAVHIRELTRFPLSTDGSAKLSLPYGIQAIRTYDKLKLCFDKSQGMENADISVDMKALREGGEVELEVPRLGVVNLRIFPYKSDLKIPMGEYTKWFNYDKIKNSLQFRTRKTGDTISVGNGNKKLKKFMIDEKIPVDKRDALYILAEGDNVLWVPEHRMGDAYRLSDDSNRVLEVVVTKR
ncbi:tRNA lysidine(34) synthetase TilS [Butyrivibrio sp. INlla16]|uniref:tRNA lysidine(34) synthetase TilS n=1 Tax=Butyrivibrio sp. INlla16 TaxID=1520807 RepID=UPI0008896F29|nr:tRNA lysidine(34) synthetase TilS [Butyrivibrio sp. INlla16]SDB61616.1 tRNA(Ile)-lysidine synthase [Butyrivibrio sp. INlla16]